MNAARIYWLLLLSLISVTTIAQYRLTGTVTDLQNKPIQDAIITLRRLPGKLVVAYALSNEKGRYTLESKEPLTDSLFEIHVSSAIYGSLSRMVHKGNSLDFRMDQKDNRLPDITVTSKPPPVKVKGDTLSYDVQAFTNSQDRVIADVIKRLPGVEVNKDGMILYQGRPISHLYIDGDDLLNGRYTLATQNMPNVLVEKIEVMENHQPVRVLKGMVNSDQPAMNLILNDSARVRVIGEGSMLAGTVRTYEATINAMLFRKKLKFLNFLKTNNNGIDYSRELLSHTRTSYNYNQIPAILNADPIGNPNIAQERYLRNRSWLGTLNILTDLGSDFKLKINTSYLSDRQKKDQWGEQLINTVTDTFRLTEKNHYETLPNTFKTEVNVNANKSTFYFDDQLIVAIDDRSGNAAISSKYYPLLGIGEASTLRSFSNQLSYRNKFQHWVAEWNSFVGLNGDKQQLNTTPGIYTPIFNNGNLYEQIRENVNIRSFVTDHSIRMYNSTKLVNNAFQAGFLTRNQSITSEFLKLNNGASTMFQNPEFQNNLVYNYSKLYVESTADVRIAGIQFSFRLPIQFESIGVRDDKKNYAPASNFRNITFYPTATIKWQPKENHVFLADFNPNRTLAGMFDLTSGYILTSYRQVSRNAVSEIPQYRRNAYSFTYSYRNARKLFFTNSGLLLSRFSKNVLANAKINDSLIFTDIIIAPGNHVSSLTIYNSSSKYFFSIRANVAAKVSWQRTSFMSIQNTNRYQITTTNQTVNLTVRSKLLNNINTEYAGQLTFLKTSNRIDGTKRESIQSAQQLQQQVTLEISPSDAIGIRYTTSHYLTSTPGFLTAQNFFCDLSVMVSPKKKKSQLTLSLLNIFDNDIYHTISLIQNNISSYNYQIRPRILSAQYTYRF